MPVERGSDGLRWIWIGLAASAIPLLVALVWTISVLAAVNAPRGPAGLTIEVTAQQWWWKARYLNGDPSRVFTTANEIHIPTGQPVRFKLDRCRRHPLLLGAGARRQDRHDPGPDRT